MFPRHPSPTFTHEMEPEFHNPEWLKQAIIYEIYPQSYYDSNGDGIGDLPGIIEKLDYIQSLGANTIWLNPCFESPFLDAGYDVTDYYKVAPRYGNNEDLRRLFAEARQRGIRVLLDLVPGHTSTECEWFKESSRHQRNKYTDWYVWTDRGFGFRQPGSRYTSISGMSERDGSYIINFFAHQPALNYGFANPDPAQPWQQSIDDPGPQAVRAEIRNVMKFWLDMGASGFRVDMAASLVKEDPGQRANIQLWREMRTWLDKEYPEAALISEWGFPERSIKAGFHIDFYMASAGSGYVSLFRKQSGSRFNRDPYGFSFFDSRGLGNVMAFVDDFVPRYLTTRRAGYICIYSGNHDTAPRLGKGRTFQDLQVAFTFLLTVPGVPKIYYGDEIGMVGVAGLPSKEGGYRRTESRTPMQWSSAQNAGFSTAQASQLYLPVEPELGGRTVVDQEKDSNSLLNAIRTLAKMRLEHPALHNDSDFKVVYAEGGCYPFIYLRQAGGESVLVAVNPADRLVEVDLPAGELTANLETPKTLWGVEGGLTRSADGWKISLPGVSSGVYQI